MAPHPGPPLYGPVETAVRTDIAAMVSSAPAGEALAALAYCLAAMLDDPNAGAAHRSPAGLSKELRACLDALAAATVTGDDDLATALSRISDVPASGRDTTRPE